MVRPLAYITSAWSDNPYEAEKTARHYCRQAYDAGYSPICPKLMYDGFLNKDVAQEHKDQADMAAELLKRSRILIICGKEDDEQVKNDLAIAKHMRIPATTMEGILQAESTAGTKV